MTIELCSGDLLRSSARALVNTVNCVGVMGKGIALQFKREYPVMFVEYASACRRGLVVPGKVHVFTIGNADRARHIVGFPTKYHWRDHSRLADVEEGLVDLVRFVDEYRVESIAVPALGCNNGGLDWCDVRPRIELAFEVVPWVKVELYPPQRVA